jgi:Heparinase II/III-like protein/Heparinase II/III N-terminus
VRDACRGQIICFGRWSADFGDPIDWRLNPTNGHRWPDDHWSRIPLTGGSGGDVKYTWEVARFPHAYKMARAAAMLPDLRRETALALSNQIAGFIASNPYGRGVHWYSGLEIVLRMMAWIFSRHTFNAIEERDPAIDRSIAEAALQGAYHIEKYFNFARKSAYNDHLIGEAFGLYLAACLWPDVSQSRKWRGLSLEVLTHEAERQFAADGSYLLDSNNYERAVLQLYLWAWIFETSSGNQPPTEWRTAMTRGLDFLLSQQNPLDGRLPNFGSNDGGQYHLLSTCDFSDYRPTLQALSLATRGERLYTQGPWDEEAAWLLGPSALDLPLAKSGAKIAIPRETGYHVLRGDEPGTFAMMRCGDVRERFSQIDMLHVDVWWRGVNVLAGAGTYSYALKSWHDHFSGTESHNTIEVDNRDQMLRYRQFKCLYWTRARVTRVEDSVRWALCEGEHYGYLRACGIIHSRSLLMIKDGLWIVIDRIRGIGEHRCRLHWLAGESHEYSYSSEHGQLKLETRAGGFFVTVLDERGHPIAGDVRSGDENSPRGWLSRYYGERVAVPSLAVTQIATTPILFVSILSAEAPNWEAISNRWSIRAGSRAADFEIDEAGLRTISADC